MALPVLLEIPQQIKMVETDTVLAVELAFSLQYLAEMVAMGFPAVVVVPVVPLDHPRRMAVAEVLDSSVAELEPEEQVVEQHRLVDLESVAQEERRHFQPVDTRPAVAQDSSPLVEMPPA